MRKILESLPEGISALGPLIDARLREDLEAIRLVTSGKELAARYARKLLHRLSQSLAFGLMCEVAANPGASGDRRAFLKAWRYFEEIEPARLGAENRDVRDRALELLEE
jgi:hypothetical protein